MLRTLLVLMVLPVVCSAQTDYVITTKADTLRGEIRLLTYDNIDRIQINTGKKKEMLTALQVLAVYHEEKFYKPIQYDKRVLMMQQIKNGYLSLLAFRMPNQTTFDGRFLFRLDGKHMEVPNLAFKKIMATYLEGCADVSTKVKNGELGKKELEQILDEYNTCMASTKPTEPEPSPKLVVNDLVIAIQNLKQKLTAQEFTSKKDALDLLTDLEQKAGRNEVIPNYLLEGLKSYLAPVASAQVELETVLQLLKK
ncbi:MAG: hypothetical protein KF763_03955 [Cyclobacteriaceae bacterium]|nr:hypothetical protein [Cyclobacteriaceae bacterium]